MAFVVTVLAVSVLADSSFSAVVLTSTASNPGGGLEYTWSGSLNTTGGTKGARVGDFFYDSIRTAGFLQLQNASSLNDD